MLKEKRINYAIGLIFCILILGFMSAPYLGYMTCYEIFDLYAMMQIINESSPLFSAIYALLILTLIAVCLLFALAVTGFILKCTKYKNGKAENVISVIYSIMLFVIIATAVSLFILSFKWLNDSELKIRYGFIVLFLIIYLFPYFCATKFNFAFVIYTIAFIAALGILFYILHEKVFKTIYRKTTPQPQTCE